MTKEELKAYISEAVEALEEEELSLLFPVNEQPDLYTVVEELTGLKGAFSKLSGATLKLNQGVQTLVENTAIQGDGIGNSDSIVALEHQLKAGVWQLIDMDELLTLTKERFDKLPTITAKNIENFKAQLFSWGKGLEITIDRWEQLLQSNQLQKTGQVGTLFNPEMQEAVGVKNWISIDNNIIVETEQAGFLYKGQLLRTAKVVVNKVKAAVAVKGALVEEETSVQEIKEEKKEKKRKKKTGRKTSKKKVVKKQEKEKRKVAKKSKKELPKKQKKKSRHKVSKKKVAKKQEKEKRKVAKKSKKELPKKQKKKSRHKVSKKKKNRRILKCRISFSID